MQADVQRCKSIVTGILLSAGEARGEAPTVDHRRAFLDELVADWRAAALDAPAPLRQRIRRGPADRLGFGLKQIIFNLLDNALEASPERARILPPRREAATTRCCRDRSPVAVSRTDMLAEFGKPYHSSKGRTAAASGLFLAVNVVRKLGGTVSARNRPDGGAVVTSTLPLSRHSTVGPRPTVPLNAAPDRRRRRRLRRAR